MKCKQLQKRIDELVIDLKAVHAPRLIISETQSLLDWLLRDLQDLDKEQPFIRPLPPLDAIQIFKTPRVGD